MSVRTLPLLFLNLGGEMLYILDQRLRAQSIPGEKARKGEHPGPGHLPEPVLRGVGAPAACGCRAGPQPAARCWPVCGTGACGCPGSGREKPPVPAPTLVKRWAAPGLCSLVQ